jgi:CheY-like chemotaxis protein
MNSPAPNPFSWRPPVPGSASKAVLLVEDEPATLRFYQTGLKGLQDWQIFTAGNGQAALEILRQHTIHVMVTDLNMPVMDGYRLIAEVRGLFPMLSIIVLTSLPEGPPQERAKQLGALYVISKPARLSLLMDEIKVLGNWEAPGQVKGLSLGSLLQLMSWESKTCTMSVKSGERRGHLYVNNGQLIHAINEQEEGLMAAFQILSWPDPRAEFVDTCRVDPTIDMPTTEILMELAILKDHQTETTMDSPPPEDEWGTNN